MEKNKNIKKKTSSSIATKTEVVTLRLDPKTKFGLELLARKQYRTLSSVVEWSINNALRDAEEGLSNLDLIWDIEEADRIVKLALMAANFLSYEEQLIWKLISENGLFWRGNYNKDNEWTWVCSLSTAIFDRIREHFPTILAVARGEKEVSVMPTWVKKKAAKELDDEIPF